MTQTGLVRLHRRRRGLGRLRAGQPADRDRAAIACCCSRPAATTAISGSTSRSATASCSPTPGSTGSTRPSRSPSSTTARSSSRAARCWAARARSTACSTSAASARTTTTGGSSATPAGASTTCCPTSAAPRTRSAARTTLHGVGGPLAVSDVCEPHPLCEAFIEAARAGRLPAQRRFQRRRRRKAPAISSSPRSNGRRWSTAVGYLRQARRRPNLAVVTNALATPHPVRRPARGRRRISAGRHDARRARRRRGDPRRRRVQFAAAAAALRASARRSCCARSASTWSPTCRASAPICRTIFRSACSIAAPSRSP